MNNSTIDRSIFKKDKLDEIRLKNAKKAFKQSNQGKAKPTVLLRRAS